MNNSNDHHIGMMIFIISIIIASASFGIWMNSAWAGLFMAFFLYLLAE